jgi:hypothetical protein
MSRGGCRFRGAWRGSSEGISWIMSSTFGRLQRVDLRDGWLSEATEFTPWLAQADNLDSLSEAIGLELELEAQERNVGPFRADILCKDVSTGHWVLIENQLERTDHTHLGQLLTYAAGLQAVTIVWIAARFTEQHRATLDWLNEITDDRFNFFGLEIELWRIGDSLSAPKFSVVSKPNEWSRDVTSAARSIEAEPLSETKGLQLSFWAALRARLENELPGLKFRKPFPQHWYDFSMGRAGYWLSATLNSRERRAGVEFNMNNSKERKRNFEALLERKDELQREFGQELQWMNLPDRNSSRVAIYLTGIDPLDEDNWIAVT